VTWSAYGEFLGIAVVLVLIRGPDFAVVTKNALAGGHRRGRWTAFGAVRGRYLPLDAGESAAAGAAFGGWRQGFLSNLTNPKVLVFYLAVLPQFLAPGARIGWLLAVAWSHALISLAYLLALTTGLRRARRLLLRRNVRRTLDGATAAALLGFSARLAAEPA
jgi:threonine/homoserine/homoserine lactone efflux protein